MKPRITVTGVKEIDDCLRAMPIAMTDKVLQQAGMSAAKPLINKAKLTAPEGPTGNLVDSIGAVKTRGSQREIGEVTAGPRRGGKYKGYAGHLVEYGTRARYTRGTGGKRKVRNAYRGVMPKKPFMAPAFAATKDQVLRGYNTEVAKVLVRTMKRTLKK
jgi:hypothetical protein